MTERAKYRPFTGDNDTSVRLIDAPLVLVLCQVRWQSLANLQTDEQLRSYVPNFGKTMSDYPLYSESKTINYTITPDGITPTETGIVYQWASIDDSWHVSLSRQFMCLYTTRYTGYDEFDVRLRSVIKILQDILSIPVIGRVGVRYVNRLSDKRDLDALNSIVMPSVLGFRALSLPGLKGSTNQATYGVDDAVLQVRAGMLAPNDTVDPAIKPVPDESWVLDLDASQEVRLLFTVDEVAKLASRMADINYDYFKAVVARGFQNRSVEGVRES